MIRTNLTANQQYLLSVHSELVNRIALAQSMGMSHGGSRDLYESFGYPRNIAYIDYVTRYKRQDIAKAVIKRPSKASWSGVVEIMESNDDQSTPLELAWNELLKKVTVCGGKTRA